MSTKNNFKRVLDLDLQHIKALIENGEIKKMRDLENSSSTKIAKFAGINQGRYASKLFNPSDFSASEICRISYVLDLDPSLMSSIIITEISEVEYERVNLNFEKELLKKK
ncbi:hypothetical protein OQX61_23100 [Pedobacter sp. PLR]|uniref:hypothetical protein n=1 Tax=Pedobacter sp. PLR TaxID=2994465 RepID=UPI00224861A4|nr:hypothetical protein [Pedobacter sp. PLR]MCX2454177.1 hypothetical protein [Pedobacter sp. PLR]